jgi:uncharacterized protein YehS (DUF1456 family)
MTRGIIDLTPNKLYKLIRAQDGSRLQILDDVGYRISICNLSTSAHLADVTQFKGATKRTLRRTLKGWTKLTVQEDEESSHE